MGLNIRAAFGILIDGQVADEHLASRVLSIRCTEESGLSADMMEIVLADDPSLPLPAIGTEIRLGLGHEWQRRWLGSFVCDEVEMLAMPRQLVVRGRSGAFVDDGAGLPALNDRIRRSWSAGLSLDAIVRTLAARHGLTGAVSAELREILLPHLVQTDESDLHFLVRVARMVGAVVRIHQKQLMVFRESQGYLEDGADVAPVVLNAADVLSWESWRSARDSNLTVVACWHSLSQARCHEVRVGAGTTVHRLPGEYPSEAVARLAVRAEYERLRRERAGLQWLMPGNPVMRVGTRLMLNGFRPGVDGEWALVRVAHCLDRDGYRCRLNAVPAGE